MTSDGIKKGTEWVEPQTQVPWCAGGRAFLFFKACDFSLKSVGFCCEMSISALATMSPEEGENKDKNKYVRVVEKDIAPTKGLKGLK